MTGMRIVDYQPLHAGAWRSLNTAWISAMFSLEPHDHEQLNDPEGEVLAPGGRIYMVETKDREPVGCVALIAMDDGGYELAKMMVVDAVRGTGVGGQLLDHAVSAARDLGASRIYLETNAKAQAAIALYRSRGFVDLPPRPTPYARCDTWMELKLL